MSKLYNLKEGASLAQFGDMGFWQGLTRGQGYFCNPSAANNGAGTTPDDATTSLLTAYTMTTSGQNDTVYFAGGATAYNPSAAFTWANNYTHLIGLSADLPGMGQRCRIVNTSANDLATLFTVSGSGNVFRNLQFFDGKDSAADGQNVLVSGSRNLFENCFFAGMGDATASGPFSRAGSYSLKVTGAENYFYKCTIGLDTVDRTAANSELIVAGQRNTFDQCIFLCSSTTAGKFLVKVDNSSADLRWTLFRDCVFIVYTSNWAAGINNAFSLPASGNTFWVLLQQCQLYGTSIGWADNVTHLLTADAAPNAGAGIAVAVTT